MPEQTYAQRVRHPSGALGPAKKDGGLSWWESVVVHWVWFLAAGILALFLIGKFRPQWLAKIGIDIAKGGGAALGGIANPYGWK